MEVTLVPTLAQATEAMGAADPETGRSWLTIIVYIYPGIAFLGTNLQTDAGWTWWSRSSWCSPPSLRTRLEKPQRRCRSSLASPSRGRLPARTKHKNKASSHLHTVTPCRGCRVSQLICLKGLCSMRRGRRTRKQCSTTIQPHPPSGGSSYRVSFSFSFLVMALFLNRFMAREARSKREMKR